MKRVRSGSALVIILGMLAFLTISAIAFSSYMRYTRLPSSYMMRASSGRWLVKAALAEALNDIEKSIGEGHHPGVPESPVGSWRNRILYRMFTDDDGKEIVDDGVRDWNATQPTLTFEGLAYVPPPLLNAVRYFSRRTSTAQWKGFDFDAGRYAYTAIDVSDYFDVNRGKVRSHVPGSGNQSYGGRTSADDTRVTLAYLFENEDHNMNGLVTKLESWDDFMKDFTADDSTKVPLVSWADLNLAIRNETPVGVRSPWCDFITSKGSTLFEDEGTSNEMFPTNMVLLTDSYYLGEQPVATSTGVTTFNLEDPRDQPFIDETPKKAKSYLQNGLDQIVDASVFNSRWSSIFPCLPQAALICDYLDVDSVPTSLVLPSVERTPMITGLYLAGGYNFQVIHEQKTTSQQGTGGNAYHYVVDTYTVNLSGEVEARVGLVYPFKGTREAMHNYQVQTVATVTFVPADEVLGDGNKINLRFDDASWATKPEWGLKGEVTKALAYNGVLQPSGIRVRSERVDVRKPSSAVANKDQAVLDDAMTNLRFSNVKIARELPASNDGIPAKECTLRIVKKVIWDSQAKAWITDPSFNRAPEFGGLPSTANLMGAVSSPEVGSSYRPVIQVWARVIDTDSDNAVVDMVPACTLDVNGGATQDILDRISSISTRSALRFTPNEANAVIKYENQKLTGGTDAPNAEFEPAGGYMTDDPRFNFAPENFIVVPVARQLKELWPTMYTAAAAECDGDIFMTTSDAGYLQSKYELAHLPLIRKKDDTSSRFGVLEYDGYDGKAKDSFDKCPAAEVAWRTYEPWKDEIFDKIACDSSPHGLRVCPYTPDTTVMMGALANTPRDWWAAATNIVGVGEKKRAMLSSVSEALKYTFSEHSADAAAVVYWEDMESLANTLIRKFRTSTKGWEDAYDELDWDGDLFQALTDDGESKIELDSIDRRFLYGYWHDCFAARQQLFLVFVRAEPMMLGGGGHIPATLGGRAVALVWRNPDGVANVPHQMRILFYKQLD